MIQRIANLDRDTYVAFCWWLRETQGIAIGTLIKDYRYVQDRMLTKFLIDTGRIKSESY